MRFSAFIDGNRGNGDSGREESRRIVDQEPAFIQKLEAVGPRGVGLELECGVGRGACADRDVRRGLSGGEGERAALGGEVLPGVRGERDGTVAHGLGRGRVAASRDRELVVRDGDAERGSGGRAKRRHEHQAQGYLFHEIDLASRSCATRISYFMAV